MAKVLPQRFTKYSLENLYCNILAWGRREELPGKKLKRGEAFNLLVFGISCERLGVDEAYDATSSISHHLHGKRFLQVSLYMDNFCFLLPKSSKTASP